MFNKLSPVTRRFQKSATFRCELLYAFSIKCNGKDQALSIRLSKLEQSHREKFFTILKL